MKTVPKKLLTVASFSATLLFAFMLVLTLTSGANAKEKRGAKSSNALSKSLDADVITPWDGNRIYNYIVNNGDIVTDNIGGHSGFAWPSVPRTSRGQTEDDLIGSNTADYSSGLWIVGTVAGESRSAIVEYTSEYIAGKILPNGTRDDATLPKYRVYKIIKGDGPGITDWDEWPCEDGAPCDADGNPVMTGDQTLWFVMNDLDDSRHQAPISGSAPIGLEVQATVFGFNSAGPLGDCMFIQWKVINKGTANLDSAFIAVWDDPDLGDASDDLVGSDPSLGLGFCYNGDANDGQYGTNTPALGFDFFQGPEVPTGSGNFLQMTSFAKYTNGAPAGRGDPINVAEVYNYMTGFWQDGSPFINPLTNQPTKFVHDGDPASNSGNLDSSPSDRRFLMSSGPFTLAVGDTQIIAGAKIIAPGSNPSSSVAVLRFYDSFAQSAFDNDFDLVQISSPRVRAERFDQEIVLSWLDGADELEAFNDKGYVFEGYRVYQGASLTGPFRNVATFDIANGTQNVFDLQFDPASGLVINAPVVLASDVGVQRHVSLKTDQIFNVGQPFSNFRDYHFAVTAYAVHPDPTVVPRLVESAISAFTIAPSGADYGTTVNVATGDATNMTINGLGNGTFFYTVVDPAQMVTASYRVYWNTESSTTEEGNYTYNIERDGTVVMANIPQTGVDSEGNPQDNAPIVDGIQFQILPATFSLAAPITYDSEGPINDPNGSLSFWGDGTLFGEPTGWWSDQSETATPPNADWARGNLEFRFTGVTAAGDDNNDAPIAEGGQWATQWERASFGEVALDSFQNVQVRLPFELWDVNRNVQINCAIINRNADGASPYGNGVGDPSTAGMEPRYRMSGRDYIIAIGTEYDPETAATTVLDHSDFANTTHLLFFMQAGASVWNTGDVYGISYPKPVTAGLDEYTFSTEAAVVGGQSDVAKEQLASANVVPNPYWAHNAMSRDPLDNFVRITNLPGSGATIRIFTLAGELVRTIDDAARSADGTLGSQYANFDLRNRAGVPLASGVYIIHIDVRGVGTKVLKFAMFASEERLDIF